MESTVWRVESTVWRVLCGEYCVERTTWKILTTDGGAQVFDICALHFLLVSNWPTKM